MSSMTQRRARVSQRGFTLVELAIVALLMAMMAAVGLWFAAQQVAYNQAEAQADALRVIGNAVGTYETSYFSNLVNNQTVPGVADAKAPTVAELKSLGLLDPSAAATNLYGGGYKVALATTPLGCLGTTCNVQGLAYLDTAVTDQGHWPADALLGAALQHGGGLLGFSATNNASNVVGLNGSWSMSNPLGAVPGVLAMRVGVSDSGLDQFLRRDGTRPMTGNLNMGGKSITNAQHVTAAGTMSSGAAVIAGNTSTGSLNAGTASITGNTATGTLTTGSATVAGSTTTGSLAVTTSATINQTLTVQGSASAGALSVSGPAQFLQSVAPGSSCSGGQVANNGTTTLVCVNGVWTVPGGGGGKPGYYCRKTSFNEQNSWDYVGYSPVCPVIYPGQIQGYCSCIQVMLNY